MKKLLFLGLAAVLTLPLTAQVTVNVGGAPVQPPFNIEGGGGLAADLIAALNASQTKYKFNLSAVPTKRLTQDLREGVLHMAAFSNMSWGFDADKEDKTADLMDTFDSYIAAKDKAKDQSFFANVGKVPMLGVIGFHYKYAGFNADETVLKAKFNTTSVPDEMTVVKLVLAGRGDIGTVSAALLAYLKKTDPATYNKLLVSTEVDTKYVRHFIVSKKAPITAAEFNAILKKLADSGKLTEVFAKYGLPAPKL